jgi:hypothetical protein
MKKLMTGILIIASFNSIASWNEVECRGKIQNKEVEIEIEQAFPQGSAFKRSTVTVTENGSQKTSNSYVTTRYLPNFGRVEYFSGGLRLEVNFWPDYRPQWGMSYRASAQHTHLGTGYAPLSCRFPNVF